MPPIVLTVLQGLLLLLLYVFVARAIRAVIRDLRAAPHSERAGPSGGPRSRAAPGELVVHVHNGRPKVVPLKGDNITFGRHQSSTVPLGDTYVSERHARVYRRGEDWVVTDLGSTNGTYLNQTRVTDPTPITAGDQLAIGKTTIEVRR